MYANGTRQEHASNGDLAGDLLKGALAGAAAVWVMDRVDWFNFDHVDPAARRRTESVRPGGLDPAHVTVNKVAGKLGKELSPAQPNAPGVAVHYALGVGPAALYAVARDRLEGLGAARGPLYGLGLFAVQDELINTVAGLSAKPQDYPWQAHARGFVAHLVLGVVTELALNAMESSGSASRRARSRHAH